MSLSITFHPTAFGTTPSARSRRLRSVFSGWEFDDWVDNLDDVEIDYFYNLMMNGQMDDIMDAFRYDVEYDDYGEYDDYALFHDDYILAGDDSGGDTVADPVWFKSNWMSYIPEDTKLNMINIPGTHDTMVCD